MPSDASHNPKVHLNLAGDNPEDPRVLRVTVKQPLEERNRPLPRQDVIRPAATLNYLVVREAREGPLFIFRDGCFLTRQHLVRYVREVLESVGEDQSQYCSHSFRIGAAMAAAERGLEDSVIKTLGVWQT